MQTFSKEERLSSRKHIELLFSSGQSFKIYPFRVIWLRYKGDLPYPVQLLISISKRNFKRAVDRNLLKRRIREAYRLNNEHFNAFIAEANEHCFLALVFTGSHLATYMEIEQKIISVLNRLQKDFRKQLVADKERGDGIA